MGFGALPTSAYCRAPFWEAPQSSSWFAPHRFAPLPAMNVDSYKPPVSPQSDSDVSHSSTDSREALMYSSAHSPSTPGTYMRSPDSTTSINSDVPAVCMWEGCGKSFSKLNSLSGHVAVEHATAQGGLFYCGWKGCLRGGRGFNARYKMLVHVRTHTKERPHSCPVCGKSFSRAENLKIHARSHSGEKPYVCTVPGCGKAYSNSSDRFKHTRTHMVEKPYCCKIPGCQKRYTDPSSLRKHVKTFKHVNTTPITDRKNISNDQNKRTVDEIVMLTTLESYKQMPTQISLSECEERDQVEKHTLRKYSHSESDCYIMENIYQINIDTKKLNINNENDKEYEESVSSVTPNNTVSCDASNDDDEYNKLCFCKDLPCVHTRRYVQPEYSYITIQSIPYHKNTTGTSFLLHSDIKKNYIEEPLDLKRKYFDSSIMKIEKKSKSDYSFIQTTCTELPLDLSNKKFF